MIGTYSELKSAVADWRHRSDVDSKTADFIALAEARIFRELEKREHDTETELTATVDSRYIALPTGFVRPIALWLKAWTPREPLTLRQPQDFSPSSESGVPAYWAIDGLNIAFDVACDAAYTFDFRFAKSLALSDVQTTNYILTKYPDVYLYGALVEAALYDVDPNSAQLFDGKFMSALESAKGTEARARQVPLRTELSHIGESYFDINRGF